MTDFKQWEGFEGRIWKEEVNTRDFIQKNYTPYDGDETFLAGPTDATNKLWGALQKLQKEERAKGGVLDMETEVVSGLTAYGPGYIDPELKDLEKIVGLQTDKPLKRAFMPYGGIKMAEQACTTYGYQPSEKLHEIFTKYHPYPQPGCVRCLHSRDEEGPPQPHRHRSARHLRPRPYRRRLPPCGPVRYRSPHQKPSSTTSPTAATAR